MQEIYKNIIIIGRTRCEKSTLANKIAQILPYQIIRVDSLRDTFFKIYPELGVGVNTAVNNKKFQKFLNSYLRAMKAQSKGKFGYILEGFELSLDNVVKNYQNGKNLIYCLGMEEITENKYLKKIKENDTVYDWTYNMSDKELEKHIHSELKNSQTMKKYCEQNSISFFNTASNRDEVLNQIIEHIKKNYKYYPKKPKKITNVDWQILKEKFSDQMEEVLIKIGKNYPVQYLIGNVDFYDCHIKVNENVLIPRFETELLVEKTIKKIKETNISNPNIIDLGTGSGCIAIAIQKNINCTMTAIDISEKALNIAKENAKENKTKITFLKRDLTKYQLENYDIIISNPPYVKESEPVGKETKYEPQNALFAKEDGTYFYRKILENIKKSQTKPKLIVFEIGMTQKEKLQELVKTNLPEYKMSIEKDYNNRDRFIFLNI